MKNCDTVADIDCVLLYDPMDATNSQVWSYHHVTNTGKNDTCNNDDKYP